ncbi:hypothetical protein FVE85_9202 [Porphyridium purpureum]|uniref:FAD dependent oxidoreductase domain-containing protein n=1 Tax=Porphyridium purpureum TaxID=35688 RepID=A0A5J4YPP2_PORPP|nr:hypothetical protein FVE85_9202 [Porphyridium purpureum]|eukprot:POR7631..scf222_8
MDRRELKPPRLGAENLGRRVVDYRPMRAGRPRAEVERLENGKLVLHNYGHGGSGWTIGPGAAAYVCDLLMRHADGDLNLEIAVVGAGILGLLTAYELVNRGYTRIKVVAEQFERLVSHHAGALLAPVSMQNEPDALEWVNQIAMDSYKFYAAVAQGKMPGLRAEGTRALPAYFEDREGSGLEPYVERGIMAAAKDVEVSFGNGTIHQLVVYDDSYYMNTAIMMADLRVYLEAHHVEFVQRRVCDLARDVAEPFVFNCVGLGAAELGDTRMIPVQGHLILLQGQVEADIQYQISVSMECGVTSPSGHKMSRYFYMFPKQMDEFTGVFGGTFIVGAGREFHETNNSEFEVMIRQAREFFGIKS